MKSAETAGRDIWRAQIWIILARLAAWMMAVRLGGA